MIDKLPRTSDEALQLARKCMDEDRCPWPWPWPIVDFLEEEFEYESLISFVFIIYEEIGVRKSISRFNEYLKRVKDFHEREFEFKLYSELIDEIWYNDLVDSAAWRGLTHILSATETLRRAERDQFKLAVCSAISAACRDENFSFENLAHSFAGFLVSGGRSS